MFGNPQWFVQASRWRRWGLRPVRWQGWAYLAAWAASIGVPTMALADAKGPLEAMIWMVFSVSALWWDSRQVKRALAAPGGSTPVDDGEPEDDVMVINEDGEVTTGKYRLRTG